jgi:hypothetical protein
MWLLWLLWMLLWACFLAELVRLALWLSHRKPATSEKAIQVDLPQCNLKGIMLLTVEAIREELSRNQADRGGPKEQLALRLLEFRKLSMQQ